MLFKKIQTYTRARLREDAFFTILTAIYTLFLIGSVVYFSAVGQPRNIVLSIVYLFIIPALLLIEWFFGLRFGAILAALFYFLAAGGILGSAYDLYTIFPVFDDILHGTSGVLFASLGFGLAQKVLSEKNVRHEFAVCLAAGFFFTLAIASIWELFEYSAYALFRIDMQEDTLIHGFSSYFLAGSHNQTVTIDGITKTIIFFQNGEFLVLDGYLDIGLYDTLNDITVCFIGALLWLLVLILDNFFHGPIRRLLLPHLYKYQSSKSQTNSHNLPK